MVNFAELKQKAEKAKDASVTSMTNTRDKYSSVPSSQTNWDPNWKVGQGQQPPPHSRSTRGSSNAPPPPPPLRSRPDFAASSISSAPPPPPVPVSTRPDFAPPPTYVRQPPPTRFAGAQQQTASSSSADEIDWANLTQEDKEVFFDWLDEFFSRFLNVELSPRTSASVRVSPLPPVRGPPPRVNMAARPQLS
ncbi:hypothetical protein BV22DRAFT_1035216 [Leucogyrophana mollusca]|uniref:Uncharacterized protein n=1 Tax=Leucogyrophana mollusca TaxID=85980 RepID=A0ACB8BF00_9AGAM|nr:hypothetical protein BV22DRAFT_1035216 [Leucogyrophana mollusca]